MIKQTPRSGQTEYSVSQSLTSLEDALKQVFTGGSASLLPNPNRQTPCQISPAGITLTDPTEGTGPKFHGLFVDGVIGKSKSAWLNYVPLSTLQTVYSGTNLSSSTQPGTLVNLSSYVSRKAVAVYVRLEVSDTGSATSATLFQVSPNGVGLTATSYPDVRQLGYHLNGTICSGAGICRLNVGLGLYAEQQTSGAGSMDRAKIHLFGYFENLGA